MRNIHIKAWVIFSLIISLNIDIFSQISPLERSILWKPPMKSWLKSDSASGSKILNFDGVTYKMNGTPVYLEQFPIDNSYCEVNYKLISANFDTLLHPELFSGINEITDELSFSISILKENKNNIVQISSIPIIKKNGVVLLLKNFQLDLFFSKSNSLLKKGSNNWSENSILSSGNWKRIAIDKTGVYKISYSELKNLGVSNPSEIRFFGNGGKPLSVRYTGNEPDDLQEIPLYFYTGSDGTFNEGDFLLFYGVGTTNWSYDSANKKFVHTKNPYTTKTFYYITSSKGGFKVEGGTPVLENENFPVTSFVDYEFHEENLENLIKSGRNWYGEKFGDKLTRSFSFKFPDIIAGSKLSVEGELLSRSTISSSYTITCNNQIIKEQIMNSVNTSDESSDFANVKSFKEYTNAAGTDISISISFNKNGNSSAEGWLSYLRVIGRKQLRYNETQLAFRDTSSLNQKKIAKYSLENASDKIIIWEVTNPYKVKSINYSLNGGSLYFKAYTDSLREYIAFDPSKVLYTPDFLDVKEREVENQNLHSLSNIDMVILSHSDFLNEAEDLANLHRNEDKLSVIVITPEQVYNEFSSGNPDPAAIRNFMKMLYDRAASSEEMPRYLLLLGDGSFDNFSDNEPKSNGTENTNYILTFQSANSIREVNSYVSDDYYGLLDDNEEIETGLLDIGIGRFPVTTKEQAQEIISKIKKYISAASKGDWRNNICFIADDEDGNIHMAQADELANSLRNAHPNYNITKIFSDAFPQVITSSGPRYPEVNKAIENTLNKGALIMNYTGHGGEEGLAHEQIMRHAEINSWGNPIYPLFVTATCEFSRFDNFNLVTAGEDVLLNPSGGGIALLTTTRLVYSGPNFVLNKQFYNNFGGSDNLGNRYRLGDLLKKTKNASGTDINKLCFTLLGDPALCLAYPTLNIKTTKINSQEITSTPDTLKAYNLVKVNGEITDKNGSIASDFNGIVYPSLFDKAQKVKTLNNDNESPFSFQQQESTLYKGKATVTDGSFEFSFVVPREIAYNYDFGRFSYYATSESTDAAGNFENLIIGGIAAPAEPDNEGPEIELFLNDNTFSSGGISNQYPVLVANLSDQNGINIAGTSIGHNIVATLDNDPSKTFVLNNYFESITDNYKEGLVTFKLPEIYPGKHTISLKAWDIFNNSSLAEINFVVVDSSNLTISEVYNYPNPAAESTTFVFHHNQPGKNLVTELQIFELTGKLISQINMNILSDGFSSGPLFYNLKSSAGQKLDKGIYVYRFIIRYNNQMIISDSKKLIIAE